MKEIIFTGRDVPIREISVAKGKNAEFVKKVLRSGLISFGYALKSDKGSRYRYFCPDKLVWKKTGYFNPCPDYNNIA